MIKEIERAPLYRYYREVVEFNNNKNESCDTEIDSYLKSIPERGYYIINYEEERNNDKLIIYVILGRPIH